MTFTATVDERQTRAAYRVVSDRYFDAMRIALLRGRGFTPRDDARSPHVFIINRALANRVFGARDAVGRHLRIDDGPTGAIVGVAADVKHMGLDAEEVPAIYQPVRQKQFEFLRWTTIVLRADGSSPALLGAAVRREVAALDANLPAYDVITLGDLLREKTAGPRVTVWTVGALSSIGFVLALIGIGGVLSCAVALRTRELAVRVAVGARRDQVVRLILGQAWRMAFPGVAAGVAIAAISAPMLDRLLFEVAAVDVSVIAVVAAAVLFAASLAAFVPALRAARVDPAMTLRAE